MRWAARSHAHYYRAEGEAPPGGLFGIVQGGADPALRRWSAKEAIGLGFDGYAIGGLAVGEPQELMLAIVEACVALLPAERPRYLMGVGTPDDIVESVRRGIDMFDCVMPTRAGRHGLAYTRYGRVNLRNAKHAEDSRPLDVSSACSASSSYSRAYLHHLVRSNEILGMMLLTWNNLSYYQDLMAGLRKAILEGQLDDFIAQTKADWERGECRDS